MCVFLPYGIHIQGVPECWIQTFSSSEDYKRFKNTLTFVYDFLHANRLHGNNVLYVSQASPTLGPPMICMIFSVWFTIPACPVTRINIVFAINVVACMLWMERMCLWEVVCVCFVHVCHVFKAFCLTCPVCVFDSQSSLCHCFGLVEMLYSHWLCLHSSCCKLVLSVYWIYVVILCQQCCCDPLLTY